jgi:lysozyme
VRRIISAAGLGLIKQYEQGPNGGPALVAYRDVAGVWTIGWGHTGGVYKGDTITATEADYLLAQDLAPVESAVSARTDPTMTTDSQFAAMVSFTFNIGAAGFLGSSVRRYHNERDYADAARAFLLWDKAQVDGRLVTVAGLLERRNAERTLYLTPNIVLLSVFPIEA